MRMPVWARIVSQACAAIGLVLLGLATAFVALHHSRPGSWSVLAVSYAAALVWYGIRELRVATTRWHGVGVEGRAFNAAARECNRRGLAAAKGPFMPGVGDADLILSRNTVYAESQKHPTPFVVVEIKSYEKFAPRDTRMFRAAAQVRSIASSMKTENYLVWLPNANPSLLQKLFGTTCDGVTVILGGAPRMVRKAAQLLQE